MIGSQADSRRYGIEDYSNLLMHQPPLTVPDAKQGSKQHINKLVIIIIIIGSNNGTILINISRSCSSKAVKYTEQNRTVIQF